MQAFTDTISQSQEGIGDIEEYLNEEDLDDSYPQETSGNGTGYLYKPWYPWYFCRSCMGLKNFEPNQL